MSLERQLGRRYARLVTSSVVRWPALWRLWRRPLRTQFERLAPDWDTLRSGDAFAALLAALEALDPPPRRVLDTGTGTGAAAFLVARRFPGAGVVGIDLAAAMVERATRKTPPELRDRVHFEQGDASSLRFGADSFDLVTLANMIPFADELARVVAPGGAVACSFSSGPQTPIYVPPGRLRRQLERRGFTEFANFAEGAGTAFLARRP